MLQTLTAERPSARFLRRFIRRTPDKAAANLERRQVYADQQPVFGSECAGDDEAPPVPRLALYARRPIAPFEELVFYDPKAPPLSDVSTAT